MSMSNIEIDDKKKYEDEDKEERFKLDLNNQHKFVKRFIIDDQANKI